MSDTSPDPTDAPVADETTIEQPAGRDALGGDDGGAALDRAQEAIDEAQDAEGTVASNDDITTRDADRAGEYSEDPNGEGGHP